MRWLYRWLDCFFTLFLGKERRKNKPCQRRSSDVDSVLFVRFCKRCFSFLLQFHLWDKNSIAWSVARWKPIVVAQCIIKWLPIKTAKTKTIQTKSDYIRWFSELSIHDVAVVGGKNAPLARWGARAERFCYHRASLSIFTGRRRCVAASPCGARWSRRQRCRWFGA